MTVENDSMTAGNGMNNSEIVCLAAEKQDMYP